ncbi:carbohydrate ABC transporter permease [Effusibacillus lacus]|uniref:Sugar permease n=1 Tax=Effusibacillus lacus TaxID=1348429 RepID=A0A292YKS4_9BACL|nr:carbohydrate ABC transporter permease [Effusibacillus lacus]TCS73599.1 carbohydrate ABC transporter membrane protein 2 (CUT1 family) [Effusibacillus lacus]GAX89509.1 sugar permease [Effusibacillus lacus]
MRGRWLAYLVLVIFTFVMIVPVYIMVKVSLSAPQDVMTQHPPYWIENFTWEHWSRMFESGNLWEPLRKSLTVATLTTLLGVVAAAPASYVISRMGRKWKYTFVLGLLFTRMFPDVGIALPIAVNFIKWNLVDTDLGLILAHLIPNLPFLAWILVGTFETIPRDLEQAAYIDGASRLEALRKVVFPLAAPGIAVGALFVWLNSWNEFTYALYLTVSERTLPLQTYYFINRGDWFQSASYSVLITIPVVIITFFLQRYLKAGYLSGAVKG